MISINFDLSEIKELFDIEKDIKKALDDAVKDLAVQAHSKILESANSKLHSRRELYVENLEYHEEEDGVHIITLGEKAAWIDDGMPEHNMLDDLLASPKAKTAKDGCVLNPRNKVLTSLGWKRIKDIVPGDQVLTHSGKFREVKELLITETPIGTEFIILKPNSECRTVECISKENTEITSPSVSLTADHLVLTPNGWVRADSLKKGDLIATPSDLERKCKWCDLPLPINAIKAEFCLNNSCHRSYVTVIEKRGLATISKENRTKNSKIGNEAARKMGCFDKEDWGARDPNVLKKMRDGSAQAMRDRISDGQWGPEVFFEKCLLDAGLILGVDFIRESPIKTERIVNAGRGRTRKSTLFIDFFFPNLNLAVELDGERWHSQKEQAERDTAKNEALRKNNTTLLRIPSNKIYELGKEKAEFIKLWSKNHSGNLGVAWIRVYKVKKGVLKSRQHVYAKKYDICLEAEEHSFCCETVFIHNSRYLVVPFNHGPGKGKTNTTQANVDLISTIKSEMKSRKIPFAKIEKDEHGQPKTGRLHSFDINSKPLKTSDAPGQGKGPVGEVRQGPTGLPLLSGVSVYQNKVKGKNGEEKIKRSIMTFRIASSKHKEQGGRWDMPHVPGIFAFEDAAEWIKREWESKIQPEIMAKLITEIT